MESQNAETQVAAAPRADDSSCWTKKKTAADSGFIDNFKEHIEGFVSTSMDQHKICLKKTMQDFREFIKNKKGAFGSSNAGADPNSGAKEAVSPPPVEPVAAR